MPNYIEEAHGHDEAWEYEEQLPERVVKKLDEILMYTAPEMRRLKLLKLLVDLIDETTDDTHDVA